MILFYLTIFGLTFFNVQSNPIEKIDYTLNLIKKGDSIIQFGQHENIILLMGNTGGGKSTLAQFMAGDNDQLISREIRNDTGEYVIEDKDNKISQNSTLVSQTIFPELVFNKETNSAYYDCPGFSDTRNSSIDIASTYFIRKVITSTKAIKTIFVVNYSSVKEGVDRHDFLQLLKHAATFYKNFDGFKNGVALVVTKVDNVYVKKDGKLNLVSDEKIITNIEEFLNKAKVSITDLIKEETDNTKKEVYLNAIKLVDIILTKDDSGVNKIGIFRRPDQAGPLSQIPLLQEGKVNLQKLIQNQIEYIVQQEQNFGYTISEESKSDIDELIQQISQNIGAQITEISKEVRNNFVKRENEFSNLIDLKNSFQSSNQIIANMIKSFELVTTTKELYQTLSSSLREALQLPIEESNFLKIIQYDNFLEFIKVVSLKNLVLKPIEIVQAFETATKYLTDSINLYTFFIDFNIKLHEWSIQRDTSKFNIANFKAIVANLQNQNTIVTGENIKPFLDEIYYEEIQKGYTVPGFDSIKTAEISAPKIIVLYEIIDLAMDPKIEILCENNNKLIAKGNVIKLSQVVSSSICPAKLQRIEIYSLNRVFFDQNLQQVGQNIQLLIASGVWEIIDVRQINLIGENAAPYPDLKAANGANGAGGAIQGAPGGNGVDGKPGQRGHSGGAFFGISGRMINGQNLVIKSFGGNGGQAQEGGNAGNGENGKDVDWAVIDRGNANGMLLEVCEQKGGMGGVGGNGGNGAKGGFPGQPSEIQLIGLGEAAATQVQQLHGQPGPDSAGGAPGIGAMSGNQCSGWKITVYNMHEWHKVNCNKIKSNDGVAGNPAINTAGLEPAEPPVVVDGKPVFVKNFKDYVNLHINNRIRTSSLTALINFLNSNPTLNEIK